MTFPRFLPGHKNSRGTHHTLAIRAVLSRRRRGFRRALTRGKTLPFFRKTLDNPGKRMYCLFAGQPEAPREMAAASGGGAEKRRDRGASLYPVRLFQHLRRLLPRCPAETPASCPEMAAPEPVHTADAEGYDRPDPSP